MKRPVVVGVAIAALAVAVVLGWFSVRQERQYRRLLAAGDLAIARGATSDAVEAYSGAAALKPGSMLAYLRRGSAHRRRAEPDSAVRDLNRAHELDPTAPQPLELLGDVWAGTGDQARAVRYYGEFLALDDRSAPVTYKLALAHYRAGDRAAAAAAAHRAIALQHDLPEAHYLLALCLRDERRLADAVASLEYAVTLRPAFAEARVELANLHASLQRPQDAIEQLTALAAMTPTTPERLIAVAQAYARLGRIDAAVLTLGRAAAEFPKAQGVTPALGQIWLDRAETDGDTSALGKALQALQPVAESADASGAVLALYGRALLAADRVQAAEPVLARATSRLPVDARVFADLESAAMRLGHADLARSARARHAALTCQTSC